MIGGRQVISGIQRASLMLGYRVWVQKVRPDWDPRLVDRFIHEDWYRPSARRQRYVEGLKCTSEEAANDFPREVRFDALMQVAAIAVLRHPQLPIAECGCFRGLSSYLLASIQAEAGATGAFHIFDSFEGLSELRPEDTDARVPLDPAGVNLLRRSLAASEADVRRVLTPFPQVHFHKGWIPERFGDVKDQRFGFVNIDVDLYEPTRDCMEFFWPRLADGGILSCDDYGMTQFPGARKAVDSWRDQASFFFNSPLGGCFLIK